MNEFLEGKCDLPVNILTHRICSYGAYGLDIIQVDDNECTMAAGDWHGNIHFVSNVEEKELSNLSLISGNEPRV